MSPAPLRFSRANWTDAALSAMAAHGTAGINIEQLARDLGATKGSFYHQFRDRSDLLDAALARWEEIVAADLEAAAAIDDPRERLVVASLAGVGSELDGFVDLALASDRGSPEVAATLRRVNTARLDFLSATLEEEGLTPADARQRAIAGLAAYLGLYQLQHSIGERFPEAELRAQVTRLIEAMVAR